MELQAKARLLAFEAGETSKTSLWNNLDEIPKHLMKLRPIGRIGKFLIVRSRDTYYILDPEVSALVGFLFLGAPYLPGMRAVSSAAVNPDYQGKGVGFALYEFLLKRFRTLASSAELSAGSSLVWSKLIQKYKGYVCHIMYPSHSNKPTVYRVAIKGFKKDSRGIVWPLVEREGKVISLGELKPTSGEEWQAKDEFFYVATT